LPTEVDALTPEQTAALGRYRARWAAIRRSTEPADRGAAEEGARLAYRAAGLQPPVRFVWCAGPVALSHVARRVSRADGPNVKATVVDRLRRRVAASVRRRVAARMQASVESAVNPGDALVASATEAVMQSAVQDSAPLLQRYRRAEPLSLSDILRALLGREGFRYIAAGQHELSWLGPYEYLCNVLGLRAETEALRGLWLVALNAGWLQPHQNTCWLVERPDLLRGDASDRLHYASGPALRYPDGWSVWAWKGVEVPRWLIERPEEITPEAIDGASNVQVRRCMIEIMTPQRYVALGGAARVAEDETGVLWRKIWPDSDIWAAVEVVNATPEPDGTRRHFFLQVPPTMRTAREAVAWTYGMRPKAYASLVVRT
jgi:Domain of unknown function (DUF6745)